MTEWILSSSAIILIVVALRGLLKGKISLRLQYGLWALVLVRLLVPFSFFQSDMSVSNLAQTVRQQPAVQQADVSLRDYENAYQAAVRKYEQMGVQVTQGQLRQEAQNELLDDAYSQIADDYAENGTTVSDAQLQLEAQQRVESISLGAMITDILPYVWVAGMAAVGGALVVSNLHFTWKLRKARKKLDIPGVPLKVYLTNYVATPCLFGIGKPDIYLTDEVMVNSQMRAHVLAHEMSHYRQGDHIWSILRSVCLVLHWYNPLVWVAAILSKRDAELACDEATIKALGEGERVAYGKTLIGMTCVKRDPRSLLLTATTMLGSKKTLKERISLIAAKPRTALITLVACILVASIAVGCTFTGASDPTEATEQEDVVWEKVQTAVEEVQTRTDRHFSAYFSYDHPRDLDFESAPKVNECWMYAGNIYQELYDDGVAQPQWLIYEDVTYIYLYDDTWYVADGEDTAESYSSSFDIDLPSRQNYTMSWTDTEDGLEVQFVANKDGEANIVFLLDDGGKLLWYASYGEIQGRDAAGEEITLTVYSIYVLHDTAETQIRQKVADSAQIVLATMEEFDSSTTPTVPDPTEPEPTEPEAHTPYYYPFTDQEIADAQDAAMAYTQTIVAEPDASNYFRVYQMAFDPTLTDTIVWSNMRAEVSNQVEYYSHYMVFSLQYAHQYIETDGRYAGNSGTGYIVCFRESNEDSWAVISFSESGGTGNAMTAQQLEGFTEIGDVMAGYSYGIDGAILFVRGEGYPAVSVVALDESYMLPVGRALTDEELESFRALFSATLEGNGWNNFHDWYNYALKSEYETPADVDLMKLFYNAPVVDVTQAELDFLEDQGWSTGASQVHKYPVFAMDSVLERVFGIGFDETNGIGLDQLAYNPDTDAYYAMHGDYETSYHYVIKGIEKQDGTISLYYENYNYYNMDGVISVVILQPMEDGSYRILSNVRAGMGIDPDCVARNPDTPWMSVRGSKPLSYEEYFSETRTFQDGRGTYTNTWKINEDGSAGTVYSDNNPGQGYALCMDDGFLIVSFDDDESLPAMITGSRSGNNTFRWDPQRDNLPIIWEVPGSAVYTDIDCYVTDGRYAYCVRSQSELFRLDLLTGEAQTLFTAAQIPVDDQGCLVLCDSDVLYFLTQEEDNASVNQLYLPTMTTDVLYDQIPLDAFMGEFSIGYEDNATLRWQMLDSEFISKVMAVLADPDSEYKDYVPLGHQGIWGSTDWERITSNLYFMTLVQAIEMEEEIPSLLICEYDLDTGTYTETPYYWASHMNDN